MRGFRVGEGVEGSVGELSYTIEGDGKWGVAIYC